MDVEPYKNVDHMKKSLILGFVVSIVCRLQNNSSVCRILAFVAIQRLTYLGFVASRVCRFQCLSVQRLSHLAFDASSVGRSTPNITLIWKKCNQKRLIIKHSSNVPSAIFIAILLKGMLSSKGKGSIVESVINHF